MPAIAAELNRLPYSLSNLDPESYFAKSADRVDVAKMKAELHRRLPGAAGPTTQPDSKAGQGRVIFANLLKSLPFAAAFDGKTGPLLFPSGSTPEQVASFGRTPRSALEVFAEATSQIVITDYRTDEDFIVELKTESQRDVMLLAKIPAESTMQATIDKVLKRAAAPNPLHKRFALEYREELLIPKLSFNILKSYDELIPVEIVNSAFSKSGNREYIIKAEQATAFVLNERGAELEAIVEIGSTGDFGDDGPPPPPPPPIRKFHFDRPFLVLLRETQSHEPYFAVWLENAELMEPFPK